MRFLRRANVWEITLPVGEITGAMSHSATCFVPSMCFRYVNK